MDRNTEIFKALLNPKFDWGNFDQETLVSLGMEIVDNKKIAHRVLGRIALAYDGLKKKSSFKEFAKEIGINKGTLGAYKSVEKVFKDVEIPEDINWRALLILSKQKNPLAALSEALEHGLSSAQIIRTFSTETTKKRIIKCPKCNTELEIK